MSTDLPEKIRSQMAKAGLPTAGEMPFRPKLEKNRKGEAIIKKSLIQHGPKRRKYGYADTKGRIWIKDRAHANYPDHWDVQLNGGAEGRIRVDLSGRILS